MANIRPQIAPRNSKGKRMSSESNHVESALEMLDLEEEERKHANASSPKAQDLHAILANLLESHIALQDSGFAWDLPCRGRVQKKR